jgi:hypothetical protein
VSENKDFDVTATLRVDTMLYTGKVKAEVKKEVFIITIPPNTSTYLHSLMSYIE